MTDEQWRLSRCVSMRRILVNIEKLKVALILRVCSHTTSLSPHPPPIHDLK